MRNLFSYDNKFMQMLMTIGDMIILNVLFLLTVLPLPILTMTLFGDGLSPMTMVILALSLFPMGGAQAGLYTAAKVQADKEDDSSLVSAYFRGLRSGFGRIAIANTLMLLLIMVTVTSVFNITFLQGTKEVKSFNLPLVISFMGLFFSLIFQSVMVLFHSRFNCTLLQLFRNTALVFLLHPLRSIGMALLTWLPLLIFLLNLNFFYIATPIFLALYFAVAHLFAYAFIRKPLGFLVAKYYERAGIPNPEDKPREEEEA